VGGARRATIASGSTLFTVPFGGPATGASAPPREASPFGGDNVQFNASPFGQPPTGDDVAHEEPQIPSYALGRRTSVSAESLVPANHRSLPPTGALESTLEEDESTPNPSATPMPVFPKSPEQLARIRAAIKPNFLFANLDEEQEADVLSAMKEVTLAPGELIIEQGAAGDYFYVVESGKLDVFVKKEGQVFDEAKGDNPKLGKKVATCIEGSSFGELALMHK
jgi:cAMP-dependent protein kinase regulator